MYMIGRIQRNCPMTRISVVFEGHLTRRMSLSTFNASLVVVNALIAIQRYSVERYRCGVIAAGSDWLQ